MRNNVRSYYTKSALLVWYRDKPGSWSQVYGNSTKPQLSELDCSSSVAIGPSNSNECNTICRALDVILVGLFNYVLTFPCIHKSLIEYKMWKGKLYCNEVNMYEMKNKFTKIDLQKNKNYFYFNRSLYVQGRICPYQIVRVKKHDLTHTTNNCLYLRRTPTIPHDRTLF